MFAITSLARRRQLISGALALVAVGGVLWFLSPGLPVMWEPSASAADKAAGQMLFEHEWSPYDPLAGGDGLGPVFNARSCVACHFQGGVGGGGGKQNNVVTFEAALKRQDNRAREGVVHACATEFSLKESREQLRELYPIIKGSTRVVGSPDCPVTINIPDFDPLNVDQVNSTALFGVGWIDRISPKAIRTSRMSRAMTGTMQELRGDFDTVPLGRLRILPDGRVGKFGWKAQFATLEEFVASACASELGLSTPLMGQAMPLGQEDSTTGPTDLNKQQFAQLVAFVDTLARPVEVVPDDTAEQSRAARGKHLFKEIGCAACHTPDLGGVQGVYSDFALHSLVRKVPGQDSGGGYGGQPSPVPDPHPDSGHPSPDEWKTPPLWGVADSAPYFHDGASPTLEAAILRHEGAAARVTAAFKKLSSSDQEAVLAFLQTLKAPNAPNAEPVKPLLAQVSRR